MKITSLDIRCVSVPMPELHRTASGVTGSGVEFDEAAVARCAA